MSSIAKKYLKGYKSPVRATPAVPIYSGGRVVGWTIKLVFRRGFNPFIHAAKMARAELGCVSNHEFSIRARLRPRRPATLESTA
jgi:hypothetical protein